MARDTPILTQEHCDCLDRTLESCARAERILNLARDGMQALGFDLSEAEGDVARNRNGATRLKAAFFPDRR